MNRRRRTTVTLRVFRSRGRHGNSPFGRKTRSFARFNSSVFFVRRANFRVAGEAENRPSGRFGFARVSALSVSKLRHTALASHKTLVTPETPTDWGSRYHFAAAHYQNANPSQDNRSQQKRFAYRMGRRQIPSLKHSSSLKCAKRAISNSSLFLCSRGTTPSYLLIVSINLPAKRFRPAR